jgi:hypothetical protein
MSAVARFAVASTSSRVTLAHRPAENLRLRDAGHGENLRLHDPLHDVAQFHGGETVARVSEVNEVFHRRAQRREERCAGAFRQHAGNLGEALGDHLALSVGIARAVEHDLQGRQALARGRAHRLHILGARQEILERSRDQSLDLRRIETRRLGLHQYVRRSEVRKHIEARRHERGHAQERDQASERSDDTGSPQRGADDGGQHARG